MARSTSTAFTEHLAWSNQSHHSTLRS
ncbi:UNVERIFIED_CONTAM: hypothetical protein GTU68_045601 [Idotea baltica]|nr:hypothetical protein [Idotea baltica]